MEKNNCNDISSDKGAKSLTRKPGRSSRLEMWQREFAWAPGKFYNQRRLEDLRRQL